MRAPKRRGRRTRTEMERLAGEFHRAGNTQAEFARRHGVHPLTVAGWIRRFPKPTNSREPDPKFVAVRVQQFEIQCRALEARFVAWRSSQAPPVDIVLVELVEILAKVLAQFLGIHPFVNGNGHAGRLLVLVLLARAGFPPADWSVDGKKTYDAALYAYRRGTTAPLEDFILARSDVGTDLPETDLFAGLRGG